jgi:hypothetical protein
VEYDDTGHAGQKKDMQQLFLASPRQHKRLASGFRATSEVVGAQCGGAPGSGRQMAPVEVDAYHKAGPVGRVLKHLLIPIYFLHCHRILPPHPPLPIASSISAPSLSITPSLLLPHRRQQRHPPSRSSELHRAPRARSLHDSRMLPCVEQSS